MSSSNTTANGGDEVSTFMKDVQVKLSDREQFLKNLHSAHSNETHYDSANQRENDDPKEADTTANADDTIPADKSFPNVNTTAPLDTTTNSDESLTYGIHTFGKKIVAPVPSAARNVEIKPKTSTTPRTTVPPVATTPANQTLNSSIDTTPSRSVRELRATFESGGSGSKKSTTPKKIAVPKVFQESVVERSSGSLREIVQESSPKRAFKGFKRFESEPRSAPPLVPPKPAVKTVEFEEEVEEIEVARPKPPTPPPKKTETRRVIDFSSDEPQPKTPKVTYTEEEQQPPSPRMCVTPTGPRLMDEINEDYKVQSHSLPRPTKTIKHFDESATRSLREYRREMTERAALNASMAESVAMSTDECDAASSRNGPGKDQMKQIQHLIGVYTAQYDQAKKALKFIMQKPERDELEVIEANHIFLAQRVALAAAMRMRDQLNVRQPQEIPRMKSSFIFNSVTFELNAEFLHEMCLDGSSCHFTVVIAHNETSRCSPHISYRANNKCRLTVDIYCAIGDVKPGFEIYVEVYMLKLRKNNTEKKHTFTEVVGTLLRSDKHGYRSHEYRTSEPQFERVGVAVINASNMRSRFINAETVDPVASRFEVNFDHRLVESDYHMEGYLRRFELVAGVGNWSMEYVTFMDWFIESWTTHREKQEGKPSVRSISLRHCLSISEVEDSASYPFSFMLTYKTEEEKVEKLTLAARSQEEYTQWFKSFSDFVNGLKYWS